MFARKTKRAPRQMAQLKAKMACGDEWLDVMIGNVSSSGFMVKSTLTPEVGQEVYIQHRGVTLRGAVVQTARTRFGVRSFEKIDTSSLLAKPEMKAGRSTFTGMPKQKLWHWRARD